jgi:acyl dehydratase
MSAPAAWGEERQVEITADLIAAYAAAVGEEQGAFADGEAAPPMFAAVYAAPAIWGAVVAAVDGPGPLIHAAQEFEWLLPVRAGDRISTGVRLAAESSRGAHRSLRFSSRSRNAERELVSRGEWTILVPEAGR